MKNQTISQLKTDLYWHGETRIAMNNGPFWVFCNYNLGNYNKI